MPVVVAAVPLGESNESRSESLNATNIDSGEELQLLLPLLTPDDEDNDNDAIPAAPDEDKDGELVDADVKDELCNKGDVVAFPADDKFCATAAL